MFKKKKKKKYSVYTKLKLNVFSILAKQIQF